MIFCLGCSQVNRVEIAEVREHFRRVVEDGMPSESDIASAAAMLQLTGEIAAEALAGTS